MTATMQAPTCSTRQLIADDLLRDAQRAPVDLPMPAVDEFAGLTMLVFSTAAAAAMWHAYGLFRLASNDFTVNGMAARVAFTDSDRPHSLVVAWPIVPAEIAAELQMSGVAA